MACHVCYACQRGLHADLSSCQKCAKFSFLRKDVPINVLSCQRRATFSTWLAKVPKASQFFNFTRQKASQFFNCFSKESYFLYTWNIYAWYILYILYILKIYGIFYFIYLTFYAVCKKAILEKHTLCTP